MNLVIDVGNTRVKFGFFNKNQFLHKDWIAKDNFSLQYLKEIERKTAFEKIILTNSGEVQNEIIAYLAEKNNFILLNADTPLPIQNKYATPKTLGKDRLAGVIAASILFPKENCLTIDCGTCITYNFINHNKAFLGGNITPGMNMRFEAMHHFTAKLPLLSQGEIVDLVGNNTETALQTGAQLGVIHEIDGFIRAYIQRFGAIKTLLTGGDAAYITHNLKQEVIEVENLVLIGLNAILNFNIDK
jgi:type III pantothenate kinase